MPSAVSFALVFGERIDSNSLNTESILFCDSCVLYLFCELFGFLFFICITVASNRYVTASAEAAAAPAPIISMFFFSSSSSIYGCVIRSRWCSGACISKQAMQCTLCIKKLAMPFLYCICVCVVRVNTSIFRLFHCIIHRIALNKWFRSMYAMHWIEIHWWIIWNVSYHTEKYNQTHAYTSLAHAFACLLRCYFIYLLRCLPMFF